MAKLKTPVKIGIAVAAVAGVMGLGYCSVEVGLVT